MKHNLVWQFIGGLFPSKKQIFEFPSCRSVLWNWCICWRYLAGLAGYQQGLCWCTTQRWWLTNRSNNYILLFIQRHHTAKFKKKIINPEWLHQTSPILWTPERVNEEIQFQKRLKGRESNLGGQPWPVESCPPSRKCFTGLNTPWQIPMTLAFSRSRLESGEGLFLSLARREEAAGSARHERQLAKKIWDLKTSKQRAPLAEIKTEFFEFKVFYEEEGIGKQGKENLERKAEGATFYSWVTPVQVCHWSHWHQGNREPGSKHFSSWMGFI